MIQDCLAGGISFYGHSVSQGAALPVTANVSGNTVTDCGGDFDGSVAVRVQSDLIPAATFTNQGTGNTANVIRVAGALSQNTTWAKGAALLPVVEYASPWYGLKVTSGRTLTVSPGAIVKFDGGALDVQGQILAQGTSTDRIWFTSVRDDSVGGDSNGDGVISTPGQSNYGGLSVTGTANMKYCTIRYAQTAIANQETGRTTITDSRIFDNGSGISNSTTAPLVKAENNWWGSDSGPSPYGDGGYIAWHTEYDSWSRPYAVFDVDADPWVGKAYGWAPNFGRVGWGGYAADPVNVTIGNYTYDVKDVSISARGLPLEVVRTYNSSSTADSKFGYGWAFTYGVKLEIDEINDWVLVTREDGRVHRYMKQPDSSYNAPAGVFDKLWKRADGTYFLDDEGEGGLRLRCHGVLHKLTDRNGNETTLELLFRQARFGHGARWPSVGLPRPTPQAASRTCSDPASREWSYTYDASGNLTGVTDPLSHATAYTYDASHHLLTLVDANGHTVVTNTYDSDGRVVKQLDARKDVPPSRTTPCTPTTSATRRRSSPIRSATRRRTGTTTSIASPARPTHWRQRRVNTYDEQNDKTSVTDPRGRTTVYSYDSLGNLLSTTTPNYDVATTSYDDANNPVSPRPTSRLRANVLLRWARQRHQGDRPARLLRDVMHTTLTVSGSPSSDQLRKTTSFTYNARGDLTNDHAR